MKTTDLSYRKKGLELLNEAEQKLAIYPAGLLVAAQLTENIAYLRQQFDLMAGEIEKQDGRLLKIDALIEQNNRETNPANNVERQQKIIRLVEEILQDTPGNEDLIGMLARGHGNLSWYLLFAKQFQQAEAAAKKALATDPAEDWIHTNLAHALLFQGK